MKPTMLSVKEVAQELGVSAQSIRRAYWRAEIPAYRISTMLRFDLKRVQRIFWQKGCEDRTTRRSATAGASRRCAQQKSPRSVKRGRNFQGSTWRVS